MSTKFLPSADALRALITANPGINSTDLARLIGCTPAHLGAELRRHGIEITHGRRIETTDHSLLSVRKIPPARRLTHRACITCNQGFMSTGPGNRMCDDCRRSKSE